MSFKKINLSQYTPNNIPFFHTHCRTAMMFIYTSCQLTALHIPSASSHITSSSTVAYQPIVRPHYTQLTPMPATSPLTVPIPIARQPFVPLHITHNPPLGKGVIMFKFQHTGHDKVSTSWQIDLVLSYYTYIRYKGL